MIAPSMVVKFVLEHGPYARTKGAADRRNQQDWWGVWQNSRLRYDRLDVRRRRVEPRAAKENSAM